MLMLSPEEIAEIRKALGLTVVEFAKRLHVHRNTVYWWESGIAHPRYETMEQLNKLRVEAGVTSRNGR